MNGVIVWNAPNNGVIVWNIGSSSLVTGGASMPAVIAWSGGAQGAAGPTGASGSQVPWTDLTADATLVVGNRYRANSSVRLNLTLPTSTFDTADIKIQGYGTGGWKAIGAGFLVGDSITFTSYVESNEQYDAATFSPMGGGLWAVTPAGASLLSSL